MLTNTITTAASLRSRSESPFLRPTSFMAFTPPVGADVRLATKKDRPPRGVPR